MIPPLRSALRSAAIPRRCAGLVSIGILSMSVGISALHGRNFRLYSTTVEEDGFRREISYIQNDDHTRVMISLPRNWIAAVDPAALTITSETSRGSLIRLETSSLTPGLPFKDKDLEAYKKKVFALLPQGGTGACIAEEHDEPLPIFHWKNHEFVLEYEFFGEVYRRSVLFLNLDSKEQLMMTSLASKTEYAKVHDIAFDVLRSWQIVPAN